MKHPLIKWIVGSVIIFCIYSISPPIARAKSSYVASDTVKPKMYSMALTLEGWQQVANILQYIKDQLKTSDMSAKAVTFMSDSLIAPLQQEISKQIAPQLPKDTIKKK